VTSLSLDLPPSFSTYLPLSRLTSLSLDLPPSFSTYLPLSRLSSLSLDLPPSLSTYLPLSRLTSLSLDLPPSLSSLREREVSHSLTINTLRRARGGKKEKRTKNIWTDECFEFFFPDNFLSTLEDRFCFVENTFRSQTRFRSKTHALFPQDHVRTGFVVQNTFRFERMCFRITDIGKNVLSNQILYRDVEEGAYPQNALILLWSFPSTYGML
jgi:hypothetical protein